MNGLLLKLVGAILFGLIYQFYYGGGDTFNFFKDGRVVWQTFFKNPVAAVQILWQSPGTIDNLTYPYTQQMSEFYTDIYSMTVIRLSAFLGIFTFYTYTANAMLFAMLSFTGLWAMFKVYYDLYPKQYRQFAIVIFYVPSVFFWGSGLMKDTLTLGALGWLFYSFYFGFIKRRALVQNILIILLSLWIIRVTKLYVLIAFVPLASFWLFLQYRASIRSRAIRTVILPVALGISVPIIFYLTSLFAQFDARYNLENAENTIQETGDWIESQSSKEAVFSIGTVDLSPVGLFTSGTIFRAAGTGLFRPFLWESGKIIIFFSALESFFFLWLTIKIIFQAGLFRFINISFKEPIVISALLFTILIAMSSALSLNFGAMVRYRLPMIPFYLSALYIVRYQVNKSLKLF